MDAPSLQNLGLRLSMVATAAPVLGAPHRWQKPPCCSFPFLVNGAFEVDEGAGRDCWCWYRTNSVRWGSQNGLIAGRGGEHEPGDTAERWTENEKAHCARLDEADPRSRGPCSQRAVGTLRGAWRGSRSREVRKPRGSAGADKMAGVRGGVVPATSRASQADASVIEANEVAPQRRRGLVHALLEQEAAEDVKLGREHASAASLKNGERLRRVLGDKGDTRRRRKGATLSRPGRGLACRSRGKARSGGQGSLGPMKR